MTGILAVETATDACSVALSSSNGEIKECHRVAPRQHNSLVFSMLEELLPGGKLRDHGIELIAFGSGPGSFTGLRVAASVAQGLAFSADLPAVAVSTLATLAQGALRTGLAGSGDTIFSTLDARVNELYSAVFTYRDGLAVQLGTATACAPTELAPAGDEIMLALGSGCHYLQEFPPQLRSRIQSVDADILPHARDMIPLALASLAAGQTMRPADIQPVYVRDEIGWKKLAEQGKRT